MGYGDQDVGVKARLIELINAVRTLMRSESIHCSLVNLSTRRSAVPLIVINVLVILYELLWG